MREDGVTKDEERVDEGGRLAKCWRGRGEEDRSRTDVNSTVEVVLK